MQVFSSIFELEKVYGPKFNTSFTIGNFDGCHRGHQQLFKHTLDFRAPDNIKYGALSFDPSAKEYFKPGASDDKLFTRDEKIAFFKSFGFDFLILQAFDASIADMSHHNFFQTFILGGTYSRNLVVGHDFRFGKNRLGNHDFLKQACANHNINLILTRAVHDKDTSKIISSTAIRALIKEGKIDEANRLLGHDYSLTGTVEHGRKLGRTLGFPTANLELKPKLKPKAAVYVCQAQIEGTETWLNAISNIGYKPTLAVKSPMGCEVHILGDKSHDLYGKTIKLKVLRKLRDEKKFNNIDELRSQISKDCDSARNYFSD